MPKLAAGVSKDDVEPRSNFKLADLVLLNRMKTAKILGDKIEEFRAVFKNLNAWASDKLSKDEANALTMKVLFD